MLTRLDNPNSIIYGLTSMLGDHISDTSMNILYKIKHYRNRYLFKRDIAEPFVSEYLGSRKTIILPDEEKVLEILKEDPRINIIDIAKKCNITTKTVMAKISSLKKKDILKGFCIKLNNPIVNKEDFIILVKLNDKNERTKTRLENYLDSINEVSYLGKLVGEYDFEFSITVDSQKEFIKLLEKIRSDLKRDIKEFNVLFLTI